MDGQGESAFDIGKRMSKGFVVFPSPKKNGENLTVHYDDRGGEPEITKAFYGKEWIGGFEFDRKIEPLGFSGAEVRLEIERVYEGKIGEEDSL